MSDKEFNEMFGLSETEKQELINAVADETINALDDSNVPEFEESQTETEEELF